RPRPALAVPRLELLHGPVQPVLHHIAHVHVALPHLRVGHGQDGLDVLEGEPIALDALERLGATDERLDVLGVDLQDGRAVLDDPVEVGDLLVARGPVGVGLDGEVGLALAAALESLDAFGVVVDGDCVAVSRPREEVRGENGSCAEKRFHPLVLGLHPSHHPLDVGISRVQPTRQLQRLVRPRDVPVGHLLLALPNVRGHGLPPLELGEVALHPLEVGVGRVHGQPGFEGLDAPLEVVLRLERRRESEVSLDEVLVGLDARPGGFFHGVVVGQLFVARGHVGPVRGDVRVDGRGVAVLGDGRAVVSGLEVLVALGLEGFGAGVAGHGFGCSRLRCVRGADGGEGGRRGGRGREGREAGVVAVAVEGGRKAAAAAAEAGRSCGRRGGGGERGGRCWRGGRTANDEAQ
ncbi:hypothetical protein ACHAWF_014529, partial [Thalassiosira exigua]